MKEKIDGIIRRCERRCGHADSGGHGLSAFITVSVDDKRYRTSGNGVCSAHLHQALKKGLRGYQWFDLVLD